MVKSNSGSGKLERLTNKDIKIINGPVIGDPKDINLKFPIREAVSKANKEDAAYYSRSIRPEGRQQDDKNASIARDQAIFIEYGKHLAKLRGRKVPVDEYLLGYKTNRQIAIKEAGMHFGIGFKSAEAAINRAKKLSNKSRVKKPKTIKS